MLAKLDIEGLKEGLTNYKAAHPREYRMPWEQLITFDQLERYPLVMQQ